MNRIEKRAIEAAAIAPVVRAVSQRLGKEEALAILKEIHQQEALERGRNLANESGENGIETLAEDVATWGAGGRWEMEVIEQTPRT